MPDKNKREYKTSFRMYSAWNYHKEIEDLNEASAKGWQLVKGGCFHSRFVKNPAVRYRYQLDFGKIEDMGRYIETFREQGWEYVNSTFNGWHYFRKLYDPNLPEEAYEIFTDRESLSGMNNRWARIALILGAVLGAFAVLYAIRMIRRPCLLTVVQFLLFAVECAVLIRGGLIMRNAEAKKSRRGDSALLAVFFAVIIAGAVGQIALLNLRPRFWTEQNAGDVDQPIVDNRWNEFEVKYPDNYFLDLEFSSDKPMTFAVINEADEIVYSETGTEFKGENIRLRLPRGHYWYSMSCESGFELKCDIG